jgi:large subunit ribosomal protein L1
MSFKDEDLAENLNHFIQVITKAKPASAKGTYIRKCVIAASMSPGVQVAL